MRTDLFLLEVLGGIWTNSLALLSDAVHVLMDVASFALTYWAILLAEKLGVRDKLYLPGIRPDVEKFLAALDIFTLPSLSEGMSNVVLEAMAAGCPVVCPDISGHRPLIDPRHDEGILLDPYNEQTLAETLLALSADPERRRTLSEQGRAKIERQFTLEQMVRRHVELYHEVAAGHIVWGSDAKSRGSK